jgi:hypothetical protein
MRAFAAALASTALLAAAAPAGAQERFRVSVNAGQQAAGTPLTEEGTFQQYLERGSLTVERRMASSLFYDAGLAVRLWRGLHAGAAVSIYDNTGTGDVTARVPHPLLFNSPRTVTGEIAGITRREVGQHIMVGWAIPAAGGIDFTIFGGPSVFMTEQMFAIGLALSLDKEIYPFETLAFPGAVTEKKRGNVLGYHAGVDMSWRFSQTVGVGLVVRYAKGEKDFTPTGGTPVKLKVGGLQAGGGLRLIF